VIRHTYLLQARTHQLVIHWRTPAFVWKLHFYLLDEWRYWLFRAPITNLIKHLWWLVEA
jgi:hypothetical protein